MKLFPVTATLYIPILLYISQLYLFQNDIFFLLLGRNRLP